MPADNEKGPCERHRDRHSFYCNKLILGPMVRAGTLPLRLVSLRHGADIVFTEEIVDFKLINSRRVVNTLLNTVDFVDNYGVTVLRTCQEEKEKVILQIGTSNAERALAATKKVIDDVAGVDVNMGCPKSFSLKGGMGAALLSKPELVRDILTTLRTNITADKVVSCKIRVLPSLEETLSLARLIESTGVDALSVHGRTKVERPGDANRSDYIAAIAEALSIPVVANGESSQINSYVDLAKRLKATKACSMMVSRMAMKNFTIFDRSYQDKPLADIETIVREYVRASIDVDNNVNNTKYCIMHMLGGLQESALGKQFQASYDQLAVSAVVGLSDYYHSVLSKRESATQLQSRNAATTTVVTQDGSKEIAQDEAAAAAAIIMEVTGDDEGGDNVDRGQSAAAEGQQQQHIEMLPIVYVSKVFNMSNQPKAILNAWCNKEHLPPPVWRTYPIGKHFHTVVHFQGKAYASSYLEKCKRFSEHSAALVTLLSLDRYPDMEVAKRCLVKTIDKTKTMEVIFNHRRLMIKLK